MAISGKYGKINIPQVGEDEPVYILRAQDKLAASAIEMYRALVTSHGAPMADRLQRKIDTFQRWSGQKKMPD
jgi:flavorubredoxin